MLRDGVEPGYQRWTASYLQTIAGTSLPSSVPARHSGRVAATGSIIVGQGRDVPARLAYTRWLGDGPGWVLLHGLASNQRTWDALGRRLAGAGHDVLQLDQRGHGLSEKTDTRYDFDEVTADLYEVVTQLHREPPVLVGQSWGGNVVLEYAVRYPETVAGIVMVDGGFIDLSGRGADWAEVSRGLAPREMDGLPSAEVEAMLRATHPDWTEEGIAVSLANFAIEDGRVRRQLPVPYHMRILRSLWETPPQPAFQRLAVPAALAVARRPERAIATEESLAALLGDPPRAAVRWFEDTDHDIHVHRPDALADWLLDLAGNGFTGTAGATGKASV